MKADLSWLTSAFHTINVTLGIKGGSLLRRGDPPAWSASMDSLPIYCDCCIFVGLSITLYTSYWHCY